MRLTEICTCSPCSVSNAGREPQGVKDPYRLGEEAVVVSGSEGSDAAKPFARQQRS